MFLCYLDVLLCGITFQLTKTLIKIHQKGLWFQCAQCKTKLSMRVPVCFYSLSIHIENEKSIYEFSNILFDAKGRQSNKPLVGMYVYNFYGMFNHAYQKVCVCKTEASFSDAFMYGVLRWHKKAFYIHP